VGGGDVVIGVGLPGARYLEDLTVLRPGGQDDYGDPLPETALPLPGCVVVPRVGSRELRDRRDTVIAGIEVYAPLDGPTRVRPTDVLLRADGTRWHVEGEPEQWRSPISDRGAVHISAERVTG